VIFILINVGISSCLHVLAMLVSRKAVVGNRVVVLHQRRFMPATVQVSLLKSCIVLCITNL